MHGITYAVVGQDGSLEWKRKAWFQYADDVCLMASRVEDMNVIMKNSNECVIKNGLKVNKKKSKVVCINGRVSNIGKSYIGELEEYIYLWEEEKRWFQ